MTDQCNAYRATAVVRGAYVEKKGSTSACDVTEREVEKRRYEKKESRMRVRKGKEKKEAKREEETEKSRMGARHRHAQRLSEREISLAAGPEKPCSRHIRRTKPTHSVGHAAMAVTGRHRYGLDKPKEEWLGCFIIAHGLYRLVLDDKVSISSRVRAQAVVVVEGRLAACDVTCFRNMLIIAAGSCPGQFTVERASERDHVHARTTRTTLVATLPRADHG